MKIVITQARKIQQFATIFANLKNFTENVCIYFKPAGIYIQCMDDSHCCLFECSLGRSWFAEYEFNEDTDQPSVGINIPMFNRVLNTWNDTQQMTLILQPGQDQLSIHFEREENAKFNGHFDKFFDISLINLENELLNVQDFDTLIDVKVEAKIFCALINQLMGFNDVLVLTFNEDNIECVSSGTDGSMKAVIKIDDIKEYAISEDTTVKQTYSLRYVQSMCKFNQLAPVIEMGFSEAVPMFMKYRLSDNNDIEESFVRIHLAQKIAEDY